MPKQYSLVILFLTLFCFGFKSDDKAFEALVNYCRQHPKAFSEKATQEKIQHYSPLQKDFLRIVSLESEGNYIKVDSVIQEVFTKNDFKEDSAFYFRILLTLIDQQKITNDFESATKNLYRTLSYAQRNGDLLMEVNTKIALGELFRAMENFAFGLNYLKLAEEDIKELKEKDSKELLAKIYNRRAAILLQEGIYLDSVESLSLKAIALAKQIDNLDLEAISSNELGYLYLNIGNAAAEKYLKRAIQIWDNMSYGIYAANARLNLVRHYYYTKRYQEGIEILIDNIKEVEEKQWLWELGSYHELLGFIYAATEQYDLAYQNMEKGKTLLLDVSEVQYNNRLTLATAQLELQRKEDEIYRNKQEAVASKSALEKEKSTRFVLISFLIASLLLGIILFYFLRRLSKQQKELSQQKDIITNTNQQLRAAVNQKETLLKEVNHRVKNNLSVLSSLLYLQEKNLEGEEGKMALKDGQIRVNSIALIHESFYQRKDMDKINFQDYFKNLGKYISNIYTQLNKSVEINVDCRNLKLDLSESIPLGMTINELMTNSFKYAFDKIDHPQINIIYQDNKLHYWDNGPGFKAKFTESKLGLQLVKVFAKQLKSKLEVANKKGRTEVILHFNE